MKDLAFASPLAHHIRAYIALRRSFGFELRSQAHILQKFDRVLQQEMSNSGPVTPTIIESFLRSLDKLQPLTRRHQLSTVRQFLRYVRQFEPQTYIPGRLYEPASSTPQVPHIYTEEEIRALLRQALLCSRRPTQSSGLTYHTLIAFLYATGLRISEALALQLGDIEWQRKVVHIRKTKFHKARLVPMSSSTCHHLKRFLVHRAGQGHATAAEAPLFVNAKGARLAYSTVVHSFIKIATRAGVRRVNDGNPPRIHDLRHTAAVRRLCLWYQEGKNVQALLPVLSTYLGHSSVSSTQVYLTATAELLAEASKRFEQHFSFESLNHS
jgi:integrase/recombinase XerD